MEILWSHEVYKSLVWTANAISLPSPDVYMPWVISIICFPNGYFYMLPPWKGKNPFKEAIQKRSRHPWRYRWQEIKQSLHMLRKSRLPQNNSPLNFLYLPYILGLKLILVPFSYSFSLSLLTFFCASVKSYRFVFFLLNRTITYKSLRPKNNAISYYPLFYTPVQNWFWLFQNIKVLIQTTAIYKVGEVLLTKKLLSSFNSKILHHLMNYTWLWVN